MLGPIWICLFSFLDDLVNMFATSGLSEIFLFLIMVVNTIRSFMINTEKISISLIDGLYEGREAPIFNILMGWINLLFRGKRCSAHHRKHNVLWPIQLQLEHLFCVHFTEQEVYKEGSLGVGEVRWLWCPPTLIYFPDQPVNFPPHLLRVENCLLHL